MSGAIALLDGDRWVVIDLPFVDQDIDGMVLREWLEAHSPEYAAVENVNAIPRFGSVPNFKLGHALGAVKAVLATWGISYRLVRPQQWKKYYGLIKTDKEASRQKALELFPEATAVLARKKDDNRAEAMLITAYYAAALDGLHQWRMT